MVGAVRNRMKTTGKIVVKITLVVLVVLLILLGINIPRLIRAKESEIEMGLAFQNTMVGYQRMLQFTGLIVNDQLELAAVADLEKRGVIDALYQDVAITDNSWISTFSQRLFPFMCSGATALMEFGDGAADGDMDKIEENRGKLEEHYQIGNMILSILSGDGRLFHQQEPASLDGARFYGQNIRQIRQNERKGRALDQGVDSSFVGLQAAVEEMIPDTAITVEWQ